MRVETAGFGVAGLGVTGFGVTGFDVTGFDGAVGGAGVAGMVVVVAGALVVVVCCDEPPLVVEGMTVYETETCVTEGVLVPAPVSAIWYCA